MCESIRSSNEEQSLCGEKMAGRDLPRQPRSSLDRRLLTDRTVDHRRQGTVPQKGAQFQSSSVPYSDARYLAPPRPTVSLPWPSSFNSAVSSYELH